MSLYLQRPSRSNESFAREKRYTNNTHMLCCMLFDGTSHFDFDKKKRTSNLWENIDVMQRTKTNVRIKQKKRKHSVSAHATARKSMCCLFSVYVCVSLSVCDRHFKTANWSFSLFVSAFRKIKHIKIRHLNWFQDKINKAAVMMSSSKTQRRAEPLTQARKQLS